MIIPNNKKYILYIKTAKTAGTSFVKFLENIKPPKIYKRINNKRILENVENNDIIIVFDDTLAKFKNQYPEIFKDSFKILIARNPKTRIISAYNYHPQIKNESILQLLNNSSYLNYDSTKIDFKLEAPKSEWTYYSLFTHFYLQQTSNLIENNKLQIDFILKFENLNEDISKLLSLLQINTSNTIEHINKTNYTKIEELNEETISAIHKHFSNDFKYLNY